MGGAKILGNIIRWEGSGLSFRARAAIRCVKVRGQGHVTCWILFFTSGDSIASELFASRLRFAVSVLQRMDEEEDDVFPDSLRTGQSRFAAGGGFNLSVIPVDKVVPSGFLTFRGPE